MSDFDARYQQLRQRFVERSKGDLPILAAAANDPAGTDVDALRLTVHRMSGAAGTFGYPDLSVLAGEVDDQLITGFVDPAALRTLIAAVQALT